MTNRETLLAAIKAYPHDDAARLIYADHIEEFPQTDSDPQRAAFIRAQVELARIPLVKFKAGTILARRRVGGGFAPGVVAYDPNVQGLTAMSVCEKDVPNDDPRIGRLIKEIRFLWNQPMSPARMSRDMVLDSGLAGLYVADLLDENVTVNPSGMNCWGIVRRGFIEEYVGDWHNWNANHARLLADHPVRRVSFDVPRLRAEAMPRFWENPAIITRSLSTPRARSQEFEIAGEWVKVKNKTLRAAAGTRPAIEEIWLEIFRARWPSIDPQRIQVRPDCPWVFPPRAQQRFFGFDSSQAWREFETFQSQLRRDIIEGMGIPPHLAGNGANDAFSYARAAMRFADGPALLTSPQILTDASWDTAPRDIRGDLLTATAREIARTGRPLSDFNEDGTLR